MSMVEEEIRDTIKTDKESMETLVCNEHINNLDQYMDYLIDNCETLDLELAEQ